MLSHLPLEPTDEEKSKLAQSFGKSSIRIVIVDNVLVKLEAILLLLSTGYSIY